MIINECSEDAIVDLLIKNVDGKSSIAKNKAETFSEKSLDVVLSYYGDAIVTGVGRPEKLAKTIQLDEYRIRL